MKGRGKERKGRKRTTDRRKRRKGIECGNEEKGGREKERRIN